MLAEAGSATYRFVADTWNAGASRSLVLGFRPPAGAGHIYRELPVAERQVLGLGYDRAASYRVELPGSKAVEILSLEYVGGNKHYSADVYYHSADLCMRSAGAEIGELPPERLVPVTGRESLRVQAVRVLGSPDVYIFRGIWIPHQASWLPAGPGRTARLQRAFHLHPTPPALIHLAAVHGARDYAEACQLFEELAVRPLKLEKS